MSYSGSETIDYKGLTIRILPDEFDYNPRAEWDNAAIMYCAHRHYSLGDPKADAPWLSEIDPRDPDGEVYGNEHCFDWALVNGAEMLPLHLYDHGGVTMRTGDFGDSWDSGMVGVIYMTREMIVKECAYTDGKRHKSNRVTAAMRRKAREMMESEVKVYDQYLRGDVWFYLIESANGDTVDSCGSMFGYEYCLTEAKSAIDALPVQETLMPELVSAIAIPSGAN